MAEQDASLLQGTPDLYVGLGELACEQGDLAAATQHLLTGEKLDRQAVLPGSRYRLHAALAQIKNNTTPSGIRWGDGVVAPARRCAVGR